MSRRIRVIDSDSEHSGVEDNDDIVRAHENENSLSENENQSGSEHSEREDTNLENQNVDNDGTETKDDKNDEDGEKKPVKKRTGVKRVVLNTERLKGPKGVHTIEKLYEGFKFKGKGHEQEDLNRVMKRLEYWAYRVFPRLSFDDFIEKLEQLGHKKDLQAHIKKYRLGMISADEFVGTEENIEEEERIDEPEIATRQNELLEQIQNENFDALLNEPFYNN